MVVNKNLETAFKYFTLLFIILFTLTKQEKFGFKVAIQPQLIDDIKDVYIDLIYSKILPIQIMNQEFTLDNVPLLNTVKVSIIEPTVTIGKFTKDDVFLTFINGNKVNLKMQHLKTTISSNVECAFGVYTESFSMVINVSELSLDADLELIKVESKIDKGKYLPAVQLLNSKVNLELDIVTEDIGTNTSITDLINLFKDKINAELPSIVNNKAIPTIIPLMNLQIIQTLSKLSAFKSIVKRDDLNTFIDFDYSLTDDIRIINNNSNKNFLVLSINATISDEFKPETRKGYPETDIQLSNLSDKLLQVFMTDYSINTSLNTVFMTNLFNKFNITTQQINEQIPQLPAKIDTTSLDAIFPGLALKYGYGKEVTLALEVLRAPSISFNESYLEILPLQVSFALFVHISDTETERAVKFIGEIQGKVNLELQENFMLQAELLSMNLFHVMLISSELPQFEVDYITRLINFVFRTGKNLVNNKIKNLPLTIPKINNLDISDLQIKLFNNYILVQTNPKLSGPISTNQIDEYQDKNLYFLQQE